MLKPKSLPLLVLVSGLAGLALRIWLFASEDARGLLPAGHPAGILCFILTAIVLLALFLGTRSLRPFSNYSQLFPASVLHAVGCFAGVSGFLYALTTEFFSGLGALPLITATVGLIAVGCLGFTGIFRLKGLRPSFLLYGAVTVFLMLYTVCQCRHWNSEPQVAVFFFPLLASVLLMLTGYYHTVLALQKGSRRWFAFCSQAALFFCLLSLNDRNWPFYLGMALWLLLDRCSLRTAAPRYLRKRS